MIALVVIICTVLGFAFGLALGYNAGAQDARRDALLDAADRSAVMLADSVMRSERMNDAHRERVRRRAAYERDRESRIVR